MTNVQSTGQKRGGILWKGVIISPDGGIQRCKMLPLEVRGNATRDVGAVTCGRIKVYMCYKLKNNIRKKKSEMLIGIPDEYNCKYTTLSHIL